MLTDNIEKLSAAGIPLLDGDDRSALRTECARLARRMRDEAVHTIGLAPAGDEVAVPATAIELGRALAERNHGSVGIVDALGSWPCAHALVEGAVRDRTVVATNWLVDDVAVITPRIREPGTMLAQLRGVMANGVVTFRHLVVDLTGVDHLGELVAASDLLDAVVVVARSGRTTTRQLQRWFRDLPARKGLGVLLTGL